MVLIIYKVDVGKYPSRCRCRCSLFSHQPVVGWILSVWLIWPYWKLQKGVVWTAQFEDEFPAQGQGSAHFWTLIRKCPHIWTLLNLNLKCLHSPISGLIQAVNAVHPICIKNQYENNNILGVDTSELRFGSVQNLVLKLETRSQTEQFRIHSEGKLVAVVMWLSSPRMYYISI